MKSLTLLDAAIPRLAAKQTFPLLYQWNLKIWQFSFNALPDLPEALTKGRERELFNWLFHQKATHSENLTPARRDPYVEHYSRPSRMAPGFKFYRSAALSASQNVSFGQNRLQMRWMAKEVSKKTCPKAEPLASEIQDGEISDCKHYVMEEQPEQVVQRLPFFFAKSMPKIDTCRFLQY